MRKIAILILLTYLFCTFEGIAQTIRRVNNNPGVTGINVYTTIQAAHDAAVTGDMIYVEPSNTSYGSITVYKSLKIYGNGYFLSNNTNVPEDNRLSSISTIIFDEGSDNSLLMGISVGSITIAAPNITITKCSSGYIDLRKRGNSPNFTSIPNNCTISNCFFRGGNAGDMINAYGNSSNCIINNNIYLNLSGPGFVSGFLNSLVLNNTIYGSFTTFNSGSCNGTIFTGNICTGGDPSKFNPSGSGNTFNNNISLGSSCWPIGNGNQNSISATNFYSTNSISSTSPDNIFQLSATSIGKTASSTGGEIGAFGGVSPYVLSGIAPYPTITNFTTSGVGNSTTPLSVSVTVRGNN